MKKLSTFCLVLSLLLTASVFCGLSASAAEINLQLYEPESKNSEEISAASGDHTMTNTINDDCTIENNIAGTKPNLDIYVENVYIKEEQ